MEATATAIKAVREKLLMEQQARKQGGSCSRFTISAPRWTAGLAGGGRYG